jgi:hypothetical protein
LGNLDNPALDDSSPKTGSFTFYQKKASSVKQADFRNMFKNASYHCGILRRLVSYSISFFNCEDSRKHRREL